MSDIDVYGIHAVSAVLSNPHRIIKAIYVSDSRQNTRLQSIYQMMEQRKLTAQILSADSFNKRFPSVSHQGIAATIVPLPSYHFKDIELLFDNSNRNPLVLVLDGVTDPHNLGACIRTAESVGAHCIIIPKDNSAKRSAVVDKVACGASEFIPVIEVTNLARSLQALKKLGLWIYGAAGDACGTLYEQTLTIPLALVLGAEGKGLRRLTKENCDHIFSIPMMGATESLNVSVATGVSLYEVMRQRLLS